MRTNSVVFVKTEEWEHLGQQLEPGWYFWDEVYYEAHGPFSTYEEAIKCCKNYSKTI